jgi:hypothetical protein
MGRFINGDAAEILGLMQGHLLGGNLFAYCLNNAVMNIDPSGYWVQALVGGIISGLIAWGLFMFEYYLGMRTMNYGVMIGLIVFNAAAGAATWWLGFGGKLQKMTKLVGIDQKLKLSNTVIKGIALIPQV